MCMSEALLLWINRLIRMENWFDSTRLDLKWTFLWLVCFRLVDALLVRTYFNPDEYWQSLEVAHHMAFGHGHLTWEWQPGARIRGFAHPLVFAALYRLLALLGLDTRDMIAAAPRLLQGLFAAVADLYTYRLARRLFGEVAGKWALFASLANWFVFYCMVRTFSNSIEASLATVAFYYWPWRADPVAGLGPWTSRQTAVVFGSLAFLMRPSSGVLWLWLGCQHLWLLFRAQPRWLSLALGFVGEAAAIGLFFIAGGVLIDRCFYGVWTCVPLNFVRFNALSGGSRLYGVNHWSYYITEAYPVMLLSMLPLSCLGIAWAGGDRRTHPACLVAVVTAVYSLTAHKEYRFVLPVLPLLLVYAGHALAVLQTKHLEEHPRSTTSSVTSATPRRSARLAAKRPSSSSPTSSSSSSASVVVGWPRWWWSAMLGLLVSIHVLLGAYLSLLHQRAPIAVLQYLSQQAETGERMDAVVMLMGCHSTPHYSLFHTRRVVPLHFLDCSPHPAPPEASALPSASQAGVTLQHTQSAAFLRDPLAFLSIYFRPHLQRSPQPAPLATERGARCGGHQTRAECVEASWCGWSNCTRSSARDDAMLGVCTALKMDGGHEVATLCAEKGAANGSAAMGTEWSDAALHEEGGSSEGVVAAWRSDQHEYDPWWGDHWREAEYPRAALPSHVVVYDRIAPRILPFLNHWGYERAVALPHAIVSDEGRFMEVW